MKMQATVLGCGTSTGVPPIGCKDPIAFSDHPGNKRLRAGLLLREQRPIHEARAIIVDCGPDYRQQALQHSIDRLDAILLTHAHFDHIGGLDDVRLYNFRQGHDLPLYANRETLEDIRVRFHYFFDPPQLGGGVASLDLYEIEKPFDLMGQRIVPIPVMHGKLPILGYRFGDFVYVTDASEISPESYKLIEGCRTLILNALRLKPHPTHFCLDEAVEIAKSIGAEKTYLTHTTHYLEYEETNAKLPEGIEMAYDGLSFEFEPSAD